MGNWDLSTGPGYFSYLYYCVLYLQKKQNIDYKKINVSNRLDPSTDAMAPWNYNQKEYMGNHGIVDIPKITNISKSELDHSTNILINEGDEKQIQNTPSYSHQESKGHSLTLGAKISTTIDIDAIIEDTKINVEIGLSGTWTSVVTNTYTAPSQSVIVPPHSQISVDYYFYQTLDKFDTSLYRDYDYNQQIIVSENNGGIYDQETAMYFFNQIENFKNMDWIFNISNGYIKKYDKNYFVKAVPISYTNIGTDFKTIDGPAKPYKKTN